MAGVCGQVPRDVRLADWQVSGSGNRNIIRSRPCTQAYVAVFDVYITHKPRQQMGSQNGSPLQERGGRVRVTRAFRTLIMVIAFHFAPANFCFVLRRFLLRDKSRLNEVQTGDISCKAPLRFRGRFPNITLHTLHSKVLNFYDLFTNRLIFNC